MVNMWSDIVDICIETLLVLHKCVYRLNTHALYEEIPEYQVLSEDLFVDCVSGEHLCMFSRQFWHTSCFHYKYVHDEGIFIVS